MKRNYWGLIIFCSIPAIICYYICSLFVDTRLSITMAVFAFLFFFTALYVYMEAHIKKFDNIGIPDSQVRFKALATFFTNKPEGDGVLLLTDESLLFIKCKRKKYIKTEIPLNHIQNAFRRTEAIVRLQMKDGSGIEFLTSDPISLINELNNRT